MRFAVAMGILLLASTAMAQEQHVMLEFLGFTADGEHYVLKKSDPNAGWTFSVRKLEDDSQVFSVPFEKDTEKDEFKKVTKKYKKLVDGVPTKSPDGKFVLMGVQDGKYLDVLVMQKPQIGRFQAIPLTVDKDHDMVAEGTLKKAVWSPDGKWVVIVATETTSGDNAYRTDKSFVFKFRKWKVKWFREDSGGGAEGGGGGGGDE